MVVVPRVGGSVCERGQPDKKAVGSKVENGTSTRVVPIARECGLQVEEEERWARQGKLSSVQLAKGRVKPKRDPARSNQSINGEVASRSPSGRSHKLHPRETH